MSEDFPRMTSHRPYLLRALVEWINDNGMTPHVLVDAGLPGMQVPASAVKDGRVVLNIAERAVVGLQVDNESVSFTARFGGVSHPVMVPMAAVLAVYARETGQGMALPDDIPGTSNEPPDPGAPPPSAPTPDEPPSGGKRPHLRVVK
ncbi:ClpXP protease specificity-enhancing factor [Xanthomonas oryzae pv. oryzae]|uniref:ClpXP protease specificity-enhancing factor n=1 Tax=Xanthomonas oryzae TaxID=347 RepID=UPI000DE1453D|nr:ClpXP protease specificity-enhancing factor [Xanthomonas oryzae]RBI26342.1 ClpXP protease specificity-enhancing factor [Xanthomonas oryzae pv. oryzae]